MRATRNAATWGASIVVLPEAALTGYLSADISTTWQLDDRPLGENLTGQHPRDVAIDVDDPTLKPLVDLAAEYGIYLTVPFVEVDRRTNRYYNTVLLYGPGGERLIHYRKRNPWPWAEQSWATEGNLGVPIVDTPFGRLACLICFDIHEQAAIIADQKIDTLLYSIAWVDEKNSDWFDTQLPALAAEHDFNIVAANWTIPKNANVSWHGYGQSCVIDRKGRIIAQSGDDRRYGIICADIPVAITPPEHDAPPAGAE